jgi:hypothetical protein
MDLPEDFCVAIKMSLFSEPESVDAISQVLQPAPPANDREAAWL